MILIIMIIINANKMADLYIILSIIGILIFIELGCPFIKYVEKNKEDDSDLD